MADFFRDMNAGHAMQLERLARLMYELRNHRSRILECARVASEAALLAQVTRGEVDEHPAYESYLAARILADTREAARSLLSENLARGDTP